MFDLSPRLNGLRGRLEASGAAAFLSVHPDNQVYFSGFRALIYSRPILLLVPQFGSTILIVPELEERHARERARVDEVRVYRERPGEGVTSHIEILDDLLRVLPKNAPIAIESAHASAA